MVGFEQPLEHASQSTIAIIVMYTKYSHKVSHYSTSKFLKLDSKVARMTTTLTSSFTGSTKAARLTNLIT